MCVCVCVYVCVRVRVCIIYIKHIYIYIYIYIYIIKFNIINILCTYKKYYCVHKTSVTNNFKFVYILVLSYK